MHGLEARVRCMRYSSNIVYDACLKTKIQNEKDVEVLIKFVNSVKSKLMIRIE